jgi:hypothetical protein
MGILGAFIIALMVAILFSPYKGQNSVMPLVILFLVLFAAGIAAQFWVVPFGPVFLGVAWFRILFIVLIFALLFSSPPPHRRISSASEAVNEPVVTAVSVFVWIILFILVAAIVIGLYYSDVLLAR